MSTKENLEAAFAGESQANRKYLAFAKKADEDGHTQVSKLFRAAADAETVHALAHFDVLGGVKGTEENLKAAIEGEDHEFQKMYPEFIEEAESENESAAKQSFQAANAVEKIHSSLYNKALESLGNNAEVDYYVCQTCGNTVENDALDICPICGQPKEQFNKIS